MSNQRTTFGLVLISLILLNLIGFVSFLVPTSNHSTHTINNGELEPIDIQCPIPIVVRVFNKTGSQCVWAAIETLGNWVKEPKLSNLTSRPECNSNASIAQVTQILNDLGVKYEQSYGNEESGIALIKKSMDNGWGCLWSYGNHTMVLVHYDENNNIVKFIDNSDSSLTVRTITVDEFKYLWDTWILTIYPPT